MVQSEHGNNETRSTTNRNWKGQTGDMGVDWDMFVTGPSDGSKLAQRGTCGTLLAQYRPASQCLEQGHAAR